MVMASSRKHKKYGDFGIFLDTGNEIVHPISYEKLLGAVVSDNFTWNQHIRDHKNSLIKRLTLKVNALYKISKVASFQSRKIIAGSLIMSTITYVIQIYGGCSGYLLAALQVLQNRAARFITGLPLMTPTGTLLSQCGWLSIKQLVHYHSLVLLLRLGLIGGQATYTRELVMMCQVSQDRNS